MSDKDNGQDRGIVDGQKTLIARVPAARIENLSIYPPSLKVDEDKEDGHPFARYSLYAPGERKLEVKVYDHRRDVVSLIRYFKEAVFSSASERDAIFNERLLRKISQPAKVLVRNVLVARMGMVFPYLVLGEPEAEEATALLRWNILPLGLGDIEQNPYFVRVLSRTERVQFVVSLTDDKHPWIFRQPDGKILEISSGLYELTEEELAIIRPSTAPVEETIEEVVAVS